MKRLLLAVLLAFTFSTISAQDDDPQIYKVYQSELYTFNSKSNEWVLEKQNVDANFNIVFYKNSINIQAKTPTLFKIKVETREAFKRDGFYGVTFGALECVNETYCTVDYVYFNNDEAKFVLGIRFEDKVLGKVNLRYYSTLSN